MTACPHDALRLVHLPLADGSQQSDLTFDASLCDGCGRCIDVCPQDAVLSVRLAESFAAFDTPRLDFDAGYCDFCMACVEVCPTGALHPVEPEQAALGVAVIISAIAYVVIKVLARRSPVARHLERRARVPFRFALTVVAVAVAHETGLPLCLAGLGEGPDDLQDFDKTLFLDALLPQ